MLSTLSDLFGRLQQYAGNGSATFDPDTWNRLLVQAKQIILLRAASFAFEAVYEYRALFPLAAIILVALVRMSNHKEVKVAVY